MIKETNNGKKGGLLKGLPHKDSKGNDLGGIKAIVTDNNKEVELELGEVIINKQAVKKHWRELNEINQSAGNGVPILNPNTDGTFEDGGIVNEGSSTGTGSLYEYFTPELVTKKMWQIIYENGFIQGNILEPALGSGRLLKHAPKNCNLTAFEISKENYDSSSKILKPYFNEFELYNQGFETAFLQQPRYNSMLKKEATWLKQYPFDLVISNPPYGAFTGLYSSHFKYKGSFEHWFMEYSMELVKSGGLGCFLVPSSFMRNGISYNQIKERMFKKCILVDAYRLPANIFKKTQIGTDIILLKNK